MSAAPRVARVRPHEHGNPRTFTFSSGDVIRLCPQCTAFDEERKATLRKTGRETSDLEKDERWLLFKKHDGLVRRFVWDMIKSCRPKSDDAPSPDRLLEVDICDEVTTIIWEKVFKALSKFKDRGFKKSTWIGTIAKNYCIDWVRKKQNRDRLIVQTHLEARTFPEDKDRRLADAKLPTRSTGVPIHPDDMLDPYTRYGRFHPGWSSSFPGAVPVQVTK